MQVSPGPCLVPGGGSTHALTAPEHPPGAGRFTSSAHLFLAFITTRVQGKSSSERTSFFMGVPFYCSTSSDCDHTAWRSHARHTRTIRDPTSSCLKPHQCASSKRKITPPPPHARRLPPRESEVLRRSPSDPRATHQDTTIPIRIVSYPYGLRSMPGISTQVGKCVYTHTLLSRLLLSLLTYHGEVLE